MSAIWIFALVLFAMIFALGAYVVGRISYSSGRKRGFAAGHESGWTMRHEESTDDEREAWRQRAEVEVKRHQERRLAALQAQMSSMGRGLDLNETSKDQ